MVGPGGGAWVAQWIKSLSLAQVMISGSWYQAQNWALSSVGSLFPSLSLSLPASLTTCDLSLSNR